MSKPHVKITGKKYDSVSGRCTKTLKQILLKGFDKLIKADLRIIKPQD